MSVSNFEMKVRTEASPTHMQESFGTNGAIYCGSIAPYVCYWIAGLNKCVTFCLDFRLNIGSKPVGMQKPR
jgi:hypothetical protein